MAAKKKSAGIKAAKPLSPELAEFMGKRSANIAQVVKKMWAHIKNFDLQDENDGRIIHPDLTLAPIIGKRPVNMFQLTKLVSEHMG